jgi:hypothetical protein
MVIKPAHASKKIPNANGPSKPLSKGIKRDKGLGLWMTVDISADYL